MLVLEALRRMGPDMLLVITLGGVVLLLETAPRPPQPSTVNLMGGLVSVVIAGSGFDDRELYLVFDSIQLESESTGEWYIKQEK